MNVTTDDGAKIGTIDWRAVVYFDDGTEIWSKQLVDRHFPLRAKGLAIHYVRTVLAEQKNPTRPEEGRYWGHVQKGAYSDNSFDDFEYNMHITDGTWDPVEENGVYVGLYLWLNDDGTIGEGQL